MEDHDRYTQNLVVRPKREPVQVNPETEEAFEESKELIKESVHKAAKTNVAFLTWLGIFSYRLCKHVWTSSVSRLFGKRAGEGTSQKVDEPLRSTKPSSARDAHSSPQPARHPAAPQSHPRSHNK